jgi:hypothetical protein
VLLLQAVSACRLRDVAPDAAGAGASGSFAGSLARTLLVSALMGIAVVGFRELLPDARLLIAATGGIAVGGGTFLIAALLFGSPELRELPGLLGRRE